MHSCVMVPCTEGNSVCHNVSYSYVYQFVLQIAYPVRRLVVFLVAIITAALLFLFVCIVLQQTDFAPTHFIANCNKDLTSTIRDQPRGAFVARPLGRRLGLSLFLCWAEELEAWRPPRYPGQLSFKNSNHDRELCGLGQLRCPFRRYCIGSDERMESLCRWSRNNRKFGVEA